MSILHAIWKVGSKPEPLAVSTLVNEQQLEEMIVADPRLLSDEWMLIGRQEETGQGGRIDLLAIAPDGALVLIELKRDLTPRDVVAQALDYASWVESLQPQDIAAIYGRFSKGRSLTDDFKARFGEDLDEESLNGSHQVVIVAGTLDDRSERIVNYLNRRGIAVNVLYFQVFEFAGQQLISRAWLLDPVKSESTPTPPGPKEPWNGEFYCSFGQNHERSWSDAVKYGFVSAGGGSWYSKTLNLLAPGDRIWVRIPKSGFVGVGRVTGRAQRAADFRVMTPSGEAPVLDVAKGGTYLCEFAEEPEKSEFFVPVRWLQTVPASEALNEVGLFGNQNTVCKPTTAKWRYTVERLMQRFTRFDDV